MNTLHFIIYSSFFLFFISGCSKKSPSQEKAGLSNTYQATTKKKSADPENIKNNVLALVNTTAPRNWKNTKVLNQVSSDIFRKISHAGYKCRFQNFDVRGKSYRNVVCRGGNKNGPLWVIGAHYDVYGDYPGADDNASAVAGLIEFAAVTGDLLSTMKVQVELVAYTLEEPPFFRTENMGSAHHAAGLKKAGTTIEAMICLEMIGFFSKKNIQEVPFAPMKLLLPDHADFIAVISNPESTKTGEELSKIINKNKTMQAVHLSIPTFVKGVDFSDHLNYWKHGYKAVMITDTAFFRNKNYHTAKDTPDTLDYNKIASIIQSLADFFLLLS
ncbi:M28 family peptidase [Myxococcota bacterium]|nr:M28 family peptidase [Myxococcota bacterium]MBU1379496.1 M28 family peptidase [Myxococcota bacterium]MBU1497903.1 M28 family peptidase [Myxococcota bacterium]